MALLNTLINQYRITYTPTYTGAETSVATPKVSDAHHREGYSMHSIHIINTGTQSVDVQISNAISPDESTDVDWVTIDTSTTSKIFMPSVQLFRWLRFKVGTGSAACKINVLSGVRTNS